ncbi:albusnodin/ikarugamycin family macrolactam cyclase [Lentzea jiangxiensis]|uniref:Asparagine synthase (Glutamine-hydrolysing) n=1 Tax=Lentzea jiangxiensis TaxID=641025 RepID=A0A1H0SEP0_9PSEU|nr:albusnodin/ikarugamycin family macrolactam cyclase [Lentzea jiangxiensis]SDP40145.1 asparagine synthase (glutamine-hydrolysing) [Lentzea jiangxiensis]
MTPGIIGVFPARARPAAVPADAEAVWPDIPLWTVGQWHAGEFRTARHNDTAVIVLGQCLANDDELARAAAEFVRIEHLTTWPGSYTVVVAKPDKLVAAVDLAGQYPLYHRPTEGGVVLSSLLSRVNAVAGARDVPHLPSLAAQIYFPHVPQLAHGRSALAGVDQTGGGETLRIGLDGTLRTSAAVIATPEPSLPLETAAGELREALDLAIRLRVEAGARVTSDFSGGLDSTSLAFLAARHTPLHVFTYHHPNAPAGDLVHARRFASLDSRLWHEVVTGDGGTLTYQRLADPGDVPDAASTAYARTRLRLDRVAASGSEIHLTGEGADALLVPAPAYLADLARRGSRRMLAQHVLRSGRHRRVSPASVLCRSVRTAGTSLAGALTGLAARVERGEHHTASWLDAISWCPGPGVESTWMTTATRGDLAGLCRDAAARRGSVPDGFGIADLIALDEVRTAGAFHRQLIDTARAHGVWSHAPFLDHAVIRACTRASAFQRADPEGLKPLLRLAMADLVPPEVLRRREKGNYIREDIQGLAANVSSLAKLIATSRVAEAGLVEPSAVIDSLHRAAAGGPPLFPALNRLLGVESWLRGLEEFR